MFCHLFCYYISVYKNYYYIVIIIILFIIIFHKNYFNFFCSGMFRDVPECSVFRHFIDAFRTPIQNLWDKKQQQASRANAMHNMDVLIKFLYYSIGKSLIDNL